MPNKITTGVDLIEVERIAESMKNPRFITRVFSESEQQLFSEKNNSPQTIAANFAGKEAFSKALGTGIRGFSLDEVSVLRNELGAPYLILTGDAEKIAMQQGLQFSISLSHTKKYATAFVVAYSVNESLAL